MHLLARLSTPIRVMLAACGMAAALASPAAAQQGGLLFDGSLLPNFGRLRNVVSKHLTIPVQGVTASGLRDSYLEGRSGGRTHHAIDIHAPLNTPVLAVTDGSILKLHRSGLGGNTIYHLYQSRYGINVLRADERLRAILANADDARLLRVEVGAPLLEIRRVALTFRERPVELRISRVNTAAHVYHNTFGKGAPT